MKKHLITGVVLTACLVGFADHGAPGQAAAPEAPPAVKADRVKPDTVRKIYQIRDILGDFEDHPLVGPLVPVTRIRETGPTTLNNGQIVENVGGTQQQSNRLEAVEKFITDNVDSASWLNNGGDMGSITLTPNRDLMITQTPEDQKAITELFDMLRKTRPGPVRICAEWVLLSPLDAEKMLKNGADDVTVLPEVNRAFLRQLPETTVHYVAQISCMNGQTIHLASGRTRNAVINVTPVVAPSAIAMDPSMAFVQDGLSIEVSAKVAMDHAIVDISSVISERDKSVAPTPTTNPATPALDLLDKLVQHFHTTAQVPLNKPVLVSAVTSDPTVEIPTGKQFYCVIEVNAGK